MWAIILAFGFPIIIIVLGEIIYRLQRNNNPIAATFKIVRNLVTPILVLMLLLKNVLEINPEGELIRIVETLCWVSLINAFFSLINVILFAQAEADSWRAKVPKLLLDLGQFFLVLLGTCIVLSAVWNADLAGLVTAFGIGSIVIGLALQDTLGSIMSGITLLFERPFELGDWIKVGEIEGQVIEINWRAVRLLTHERDLIIVPHLVIGKETILNESQPPGTGIENVKISFSLADPPNLVKQIMKSTALTIPGILTEPPPEVHTLAYNESSITYDVRFYLDDYGKILEIRDELLTRIWYAAKRNNLTIPFPMRTLHLYDGKTLEIKNNTSEKFVHSLKSIVPQVREQENWDELTQGSSLQHFGKGETVIKAGEVSHALYIIIAGEAAMTVINEMGREQEIMRVARGEFFGEMALFSRQASAVTVKAISDLEVMVIYADAVNKIIENQPSLAREIAQIIEARRKEIPTFNNGLQKADLVSHQQAEVN